MKALDLFCGAGGASMGLHRAGYEVTGVDIEPQPNYPFEFVELDVFTLTLDYLRQFDLIWASPPCQAFTAYKRRSNHVREREDLIPAIRRNLAASGGDYIVENVPGAPLHGPVLLCGSMFGLEVRRHRLFETPRPLLVPSCNHAAQRGSFPQATNRANRRKTVEVGVWRIPLETQQRAMGIDWMTREELSQAVPPAYSEYLARQLG